jgi:hypothetical protein
MSLVEELHSQHKARLARMGAPSPYQAPYCPPPAPSPAYPSFNIQTLYYHQMWFFDLITERRARPAEPPKVEQIQRAVAIHFGISKMDLLSARRSPDVARPRQIGMYLSKTLSLKSLPDIGRRFGRDHTTILHGIRKIESLLLIDEQMRRDVESIKASLR